MPLAWVALTVVSVACIDQASKAVLLSRLSLNQSVRLSRGVRLRHVVNAGWITASDRQRRRFSCGVSPCRAAC